MDIMLTSMYGMFLHVYNVYGNLATNVKLVMVPYIVHQTEFIIVITI